MTFINAFKTHFGDVYLYEEDKKKKRSNIFWLVSVVIALLGCALSTVSNFLVGDWITGVAMLGFGFCLAIYFYTTTLNWALAKYRIQVIELLKEENDNLRALVALYKRYGNDK
jgi:hypothetical protein